MVVEVTLRQLLDMSIGSPEIGAVNFNYMYSLLHIMIVRMEKLLDASLDAGILEDYTLRESIRVDALRELPTLTSKRSGTTLPTTSREPTSTREVTSREPSSREPTSREPSTRDTTSKKSDESSSKSTISEPKSVVSESASSASKVEQLESKKKLPPTGKSVSSTTSKKTMSKTGSRKDAGTPVEDDSRGSLGRNVVMSKQSWLAIQKKMKMLEDQVDTLLRAESEDILGHIQKYAPDLSTSQYIDMAQRITQSKRMDITEQLLNQLSVIIEDTNNQVAELKEQSGESEELKSLVHRVKDIEMTFVTDKVLEASMVSIEKVLGLQLERPTQKPRISISSDLEVSDEETGLKQKITNITKQTHTLMDLMDSKMDKELYTDITGMSPAILEQIQRIRHGAKFVEKYRLQYELQDKILVELTNKLIDQGLDVSEVLQLKIQMEDELMAKLREKDLLDEKHSSITSRRITLSDKSTESEEAESTVPMSSAVSKKLVEMEHEIREVSRKLEKFTTGAFALPTTSQEEAGQLEDAKNKIMDLYENFDSLTEQITQIVDDGIDKQKQIQKILESITNIKESKAEVEEVALLKEEKADKMMVESKVDHEIFETALNEFQQEMSALEDKITYVDECHQTTMNTINDTLAEKAEKAEITPLKDYINSKVRMLLIKIKKLSGATGPEDGAATRKQLLKKFHCISCDKPVVVPTTFGQNAPAPQMPAKQSIGPFTSYEIELVRQQKKLSLGKKCTFKPTMSETARTKRLQQEAARSQVVGSLGPIKEGLPQGLTEVAENVDTRYCGGSHTLTFPFQKMFKTGSTMFDDVPVIRQEVQVQGTDGQFYKGSPVITSPKKQGEKEERKAAGGGNVVVDAPMSCIPFPNMMSGKNEESARGAKKEKIADNTPSPTAITAPTSASTATPATPASIPAPTQPPEKEEKAGITVSTTHITKRNGSSGPTSAIRRPLTGSASPRQSPPPPPPPLSSSIAPKGSLTGMQAKFTSLYGSQASRPASGMLKSSSGTGLQIRGSQSGAQRVSSTGQLSRTSSSGGSISQLPRGRTGRTRDPDS